ncbi:MAG: SpoIIE family protein phosphatase [Bacteroidales bacterium]|nr:SpoIIE family protein phosphatase [Bacteroidales bacterium]
MTSLEIILLIVAVVLAGVIAYVMFNYRKFLTKAARRMGRRFNALLRERDDEISRLRAVNSELKRNGADVSQQKVLNQEQVRLLDNEKSLLEQKKIEAAQNELADRNRILWDMSVQIEKERQHINALKNEIEAQHHSVTSSIRYAKLIQNAVLPPETILKESFEDVFLFWLPRDIVSGDYYWMKRIGNNVIFSVADCTGHGVPGAFMSMLGVAFLNEVCLNFNNQTTPADILEEMRRMVISTLKQDDANSKQKDGMDMGLCILNLDTMKMQFAGANNGMYKVRGSELTEYKPVRNPVGTYPRIIPFENHDVDIQHGDYVYMYSDGYADQFDAQNHKFTSRRLRELLVEINTLTKSAAQQADLLNQRLEEWRAGAEQMDDILIGGYCIR